MTDVTAIRPFLDAEHLALAGRAEAFATLSIAPLPMPADDQGARTQARTILTMLGKDGWFEPIANADLRACGLVRETLAEASPLADAVFALQALGTFPIILAGHAGLQKRWMDPARSGKAMAAFAMTEPDAGSDVAAIATTATHDDDGWILNGTKTFISNAGIADFYTTFATTDRSAGHRGVACFVVPADAKGLRFVRPLVLSAPHPLGEIAFEHCRVPDAAMLAPAGEGFRLGMRTLDRLRATVAAAACGLAARALDEAGDYAVRRTQFGKPLADFQLVQAKIARMATDLTAARLLTYRALHAADKGADRVTVEAAMAKAFATEAAQRIVDDAVQIFGGRGVLADHPVDRLYRAVRALRIYEGTTEMQHLIIARALLEGRAE